MSKSNLYKWYNLATDEEKNAINWYPTALAQCQDIADTYKIELVRIVYAVAVMSPRIAWQVNLQAVIDLITTGNTVYGFGVNRTKAIQILDGNLEYLRGPKVTRFAYNILHAHNPNDDKVTLDQWALRAYHDTIEILDGQKEGDEYERISQDYRDVAAELGLKPSEFQAVVWVVIKDRGMKIFRQRRSNNSK